MNRILIFSLSYAPMWGGAEIAIQEITNRIPSGRFCFDMICMRFDSTLSRYERIGNIDVHRIGHSVKSPSAKDLMRLRFRVAKLVYPILAVRKAIELHRAHRYSGAWAMMSYTGFAAYFFYLLKGVPYVLTLQEGDDLKRVAGRPIIKVLGKVYRKVFIHATVVQSISRSLADFGERMGARKSVLIPNGVNRAVFKTGSDTGLLRQQCNLSATDKIIITTSRLVAKNGIDVLIRAMAYVPHDVHLCIVGDGSDKESLMALAENERLSNNVHFLGARMHADLPELLRGADVFVRVSRSEGQGISFLEAMAVGVPVVATRVGGIPDFLTDGENGIFVEVEDPHGTARAIERLLADEKLRLFLVKNAQKTVTRYTWEEIARSMQEKVFNTFQRSVKP